MSFHALDGVVRCGCRSRSSVRSVRTDRTRHDHRRRHGFVEGRRAWCVDRRHQYRNERHDQCRVVRLRQLQRGEPAARHLSNRGDTPGFPDVEGRRDNPQRGHDRSRRRDAESRLDQRVRPRRRRERDGVDRRRQGCDHRVEPPHRRASARRRRRNAESVRPAEHRARSARQRQHDVARRRTGRLVRCDARRHFGQHQPSGSTPAKRRS